MAKEAEKEHQWEKRNTREVWCREHQEKNGSTKEQITVLNPEKSREMNTEAQWKAAVIVARAASADSWGYVLVKDT